MAGVRDPPKGRSSRPRDANAAHGPDCDSACMLRVAWRRRSCTHLGDPERVNALRGYEHGRSDWAIALIWQSADHERSQRRQPKRPLGRLSRRYQGRRGGVQDRTFAYASRVDRPRRRRGLTWSAVSRDVATGMSPTRSPAVGRRERQSDRAELCDERRRRATLALGSSQTRRAASDGPVITGEATASVSMGGAESGWIRTNEYAMRRRISSRLRAADAASADRDVPEFLRAPR
jgi:hypothetical protein